MKALILAAGRGTRVQPVTDSIPKPMIPIIHKPVMEFLVDLLRRHGFDEIIVNTSHLAPEIEHYFGDGHRFGVSMAYSFEGYKSNGKLVSRPLGSAGAIRKIQSFSGFFDDTFAVLCGDALVDLDLTALLDFHRKKGGIATVALKTVATEQLENYGVALCDANQRIISFQEKPKPAEALSRQASTGIYLFEPDVLAAIPREGAFDIGSQLFPQLAADGKGIYGIELPAFAWHDIGRLQDYHQTIMAAMQGDIAGISLPGRELRPGLHVGPNVCADFSDLKISGPVVIGGSARIEKGCTIIGPAVIGAGAILENNVHLERSVVLDQTRVAAFSNLKDRVVSGGYCIGADGTVLDGRHTDNEWLFSDARNLMFPLTDDQRWVLSHQIEVARMAEMAAGDTSLFQIR